MKIINVHTPNSPYGSTRNTFNPPGTTKREFTQTWKFNGYDIPKKTGKNFKEILRY